MELRGSSISKRSTSASRCGGGKRTQVNLLELHRPALVNNAKGSSSMTSIVVRKNLMSRDDGVERLL